MKLKATEKSPGRLLILSDGKPGHVNQSIAFARHLGCDYDLCQVRFRSRLAKAVSYLLDRCGVLNDRLFRAEPVSGRFAAVVSAGSETYYANKVLSRRLGARSVAIMLPRGYRFDFDLIVAQQHDEPPPLGNLLSVPINLTYIEPQGLVDSQPGQQHIALIIGGDSRHGRLEVDLLRQQVNQVFQLFPDGVFWLTTSRRTPKAVETMLEEFSFSRAVYYSREPINPIPDFLAHSDYLFLTPDSTSMISEAVSFGRACVEILPSASPPVPDSKFARFLNALMDRGCLRMFDGSVGCAAVKIDLGRELAAVSL